MNNKKILFLVILLVFTSLATACVDSRPAEKQIADIVQSVKDGEPDKFYRSVNSDSHFKAYFDGINSDRDDGMYAVYKKVQSISKKFEFDIIKNDEELYTLEVKAYEGYYSIREKMLEAAIEGPDKFADLPGWVCDGLDNAVNEKGEIIFNANQDKNEAYQVSDSSSFFNALTVGAYKFLGDSMTRCENGNYTTMLIAHGDEIVYSANYVHIDLSDYSLSEEEKNKFVSKLDKEYEDVEGIDSKSYIKDDEIVNVLVIDYSMVDFYTLKELGLVSNSNFEVVSLEETVLQYKSEGAKCTTDYFGIK